MTTNPITFRRHRPGPWTRFLRQRRGSVLVELAFVFPVVLIILMGTYDTGRYVLLQQKLGRAAASVADLVSQPTSISQSQIDSMIIAANEMIQPFDLSQRGRVIVSSVTKPAGGSPQVDWQHEGGGSLSVTSTVGVAAGNATLPNGFDPRDDENLIVAEVFFDYEPMFFGYMISAGTISQTALRKPRQADLSTLN